jgi:signal transduction histidine kinase/CheY-like chemotaxis protein
MRLVLGAFMSWLSDLVLETPSEIEPTGPSERELALHVVMSNRVGLAFACFGSPFVYLFATAGELWSAALCAVGCLFFVSTPMTNKWIGTTLGRAQPFLAGTLVITTLTLQHGLESWMPVFLFAVLPLPPLLFSLSERRVMLVLELLLVFAFVVSATWSWAYPPASNLADSLPSLPYFVMGTAFLATITMTMFIVTQLYRQQREYRDVAERSLRAERDANHAKRRAEAANRAKDEFVATVSHEIRTPLNGVLGIAELLRSTPLGAKQREMVGVIIRSGEFLRLIINDILDFSKIVAGQMDLEEVRFYASDLVEQTLDLLSASAGEKDLALCVDIDDGGDMELVGDPVRIRQILMNLVNNAIKFTHEGFVETRLRVTLGADQARVVLEVEDSGIGIAEEHRHRIFQPFFQSESSYTRRFGGTGLGLTICHQLATMMNGELSFTSRLGHGTTFRFEAPYRYTGEQREPRRLDGVTVAVATPTSRRTASLVRTLTRMGARTTTRGAYDRDRDEPPDVVLVDVSLSRAPLAPAVIAAEFGVQPRRVVELRSRDLSRDQVDAHYPCTPAVLFRVIRHSLRERRRRSDSRLLNAYSTPKTDGPPATHFKGLHVLVAEDIHVNQMVIEGFLRQLGVTCDVVADGLAACTTFDLTAHHVVFMDLSMPVLDGTDAAARIRKERDPTAKVPIVATTAHASDEARSSGLDSGFDDYLTKPLELSAFIRVFRRFYPDYERADA